MALGLDGSGIAVSFKGSGRGGGGAVSEIGSWNVPGFGFRVLIP